MDNLPLYNYQKKCIAFIRRHKGKALLALDCGLGKTLTSLAYAQYHKRILIVSPASVKYQWKQEIETYFGVQRINILEGKKHKNKMTVSKYYIINYDILSSWTSELVRLNPDIIIIDECQYLKSRTSNRTKAMFKIAHRVNDVVGLSGTPIMNRPIEFYSILKIINKNIFPNIRKYVHRYCYNKNFFAPGGYDDKGATNLEELSQILSSKVMIRMRKEEVLKDLPDTIKTVIPLKIDLAEYNKAKTDIKSWLANNNIEKETVLAMTKIEYLKQISANAKIPQVISWVNDFLCNGKKIVLFASHKTIINQLVEAYEGKILKVDGSTPVKHRQGIVKQFNDDDNVKILIGNIKAMGTGLNGIQDTCSDVGFLELPWTPAELEQAYSRLHRIGQRNTVNVIFFLVNNTIDRYIFNIITDKKIITDTIVEGGATKNSNNLKEIMKSLK